MSFIQKIISDIQKIPKPVQRFAKQAIILFLIWKTVYLIFLLPNRLLDSPLTNSVGTQTAWFLNVVNHTESFSAEAVLKTQFFEGNYIKSNVSMIRFNGNRVLFIADGCNGLELFILYIGFILAMPSKLKRKVFFLIAGVIIIHLLNILRCAGLATIHIHINQYFEFAHHYVFKITLYVVIFILWTTFSRKLDFKSND